MSTLLKLSKDFFNLLKLEEDKKALFVFNTVISIIIVLFLHALESTHWFERKVDSILDIFISMEAKSAITTYEESESMLILDIQNYVKKNVKNDQNNFVSNRGAIAKLLKMALTGGASVIILDFSLEKKDCCHPDGDLQLKRVLTENIQKKTKIIFPVRIGRNGRIRNLICDEQIDRFPNYRRAISTLYASPDDSIIRHWKTFQQYDGNKILWSIPVLAVALYKEKENQLKKLESLLIQKNKLFDIYTMEIEGNGEKKRILLPMKEVDYYLQRIRFNLIPKNCFNSYPEGNIPIHQLSTGLFKNKIVIIGNSDPELTDLTSTPIGKMSGMFIIGNAMHTLLYGKQPTRVDLWVSILFNLLTTIIFSYLYAYIDTFFADLLITVIGFIGFGIAAFFLFFSNFGIFPNYIFSIIAIGFLEHMNSAKNFISRKIKIKKGDHRDKNSK